MEQEEDRGVVRWLRGCRGPVTSWSLGLVVEVCCDSVVQQVPRR